MLKKTKIRLGALAAAALAAALPLAVGADARPKGGGEQTGTADVQLLGFNDFHGALQPRSVSGQPAGGAAYLAAYLDKYAAQNPEGTIRVHDGDAVGASPLVSSYFHDEPAIEAMNLMDLDLGTLGNHEFDEGGEEMFRLLDGGQRTDEGAFKDGANGEPVNTSNPGFEGANFRYISANSVDAGTDDSILKPYEIVERDGEKIGFIGINTPETEKIVVPEFVAPYDFLDISDTVNKWVPKLQKKGVESIVVLAHSGGSRGTNGAYSGEIITETEQMDDAVDVVVSGHSHTLINTEVDGKRIVQAYSNGTAIDVVNLKIDRQTNDVVSETAEIVTTYHNNRDGSPAVTPDAEVQALVDGYQERVDPIANRVVGTAPATITRTNNASGESALGDLIADAQRDAAAADFAFMNPGGIRADIDAGEVTYGDLFTVQPFDNGLVSMELTGEQVYRLLEQQFVTNRILQVSGLEYTYNSAEKRIVSVTLPDGSTLPRDNTVYTVAANGYIATGGDGFSVFTEGQNVQSVGGDLDALVEYIEEDLGGVATPPADAQTRITKVG